MLKKGQVTAFILIGLMILLIVFGVIAVQQGYLKTILEKLNLARNTPAELNPVETFLSGCLKQVSLDGINLVGLQGGYINLPQDPIPNSPFTPIKQVLEIIPDSSLKTSLWFRERGNGLQVIDIPSKETIESELEGYVNLNFNSCLNNLTSFFQQGYLLSGSGIPSSNVKISDNKVNVEVDFPIKVKKDENEFSLEKHSAELTVKLGEMYNMATEIMDYLYKTTFLENQTINTLVAYDPQIPFSGVDLECGEKVWSKPEAIFNLKNALFENIAVTSIKNTNRELTDKSLEYLQFDPLKNSHKDIDANLMYIPSWPTLVEIQPSEGNLLKSNSLALQSGGLAASLVSSFACISDHRFIYDIKYPVLITLRDPENFIFQFGTEVIVDNNQPRVNYLELPETPEIEDTVCKYPQKEANIYTATYNQEGDIVPLSGVNLNFKCYPSSCDLGTSSLSNTPVLNTKVPLCFNGIVEGRKEGYSNGKALFSSNEESTNDVVVALEPVYKKKVEVKVIDKKTGEVREPYESEQISFQFIHKSITYTANYITPDEEVPLLVGDYEINSYIIRKPTWAVTTQKQVVENCVDTRGSGLIGFFKTTQHCEQTEIPSVKVEYILTGGAKFEHEFRREELASDASLKLYVLSDELPSDLDSMQKIQISLDTNKNEPLFRKPEV